MLNHLYAILTLILILIFAPLRNRFSQITILSFLLNILVTIIFSHFRNILQGTVQCVYKDLKRLIRRVSRVVQ